MNRKLFTGLIVLMGISILGIIAVQLVWMNNAIRVKNELFNRSVNEALISTVNKLEDIHNFGVVNRMVFDDSLHWSNKQEETFEFDFVSKNHDIHRIDTLHKTGRPVRIIREFKPGKKNSRIEIKVDSDSKKSGTISYQVNTETSSNSDVFIFNDDVDSGNSVFLVKTDTIISDVDSLYEIGVVKIDSVLTSLDTFSFFQPDISQRARLKAGNLKRIANQVVTEISDWDIQQIDKDLIRKVLDEEMQNSNIPIEFEFGILQDSVLLNNELDAPDSLLLLESPYLVNLYPNDIFQKNLKLAVYFPERDSFIYRSLNWLLLASFMFSLIILFTFALSIFYMLRQKKISEMKSDFINNMTHEFKTPIATISVATDSIVNDKVLGNPERIRYFAGMIKKENNRMNRQVEDILTIARLDKKDFEFNWETINIHEHIEDAIQGIGLQVEKPDGYDR